MITREAYEVAIILFILIGIGIAIWRGGARNPVGTGQLRENVRAIASKVSDMEKRVEDIEANGATSEDIERLEAGLEKHARELKEVASTVALLPERVETNRLAITKIADALPDIESRQRAMSDQVSEIKAAGAARTASLEHVKQSVDRLYDILVKRGVDQ